MFFNGAGPAFRGKVATIAKVRGGFHHDLSRISGEERRMHKVRLATDAQMDFIK
jgi:hypothetical protein